MGKKHRRFSIEHRERDPPAISTVSPSIQVAHCLDSFIGDGPGLPVGTV